MKNRLATLIGIVWLSAVIGFVLAPLLIALVVSFSDSELISFPISSYSVRWFATAWQKEIFWRSALNSLWLALAAVAVAGPAGLAAALAIRRAPRAIAQPIEAVLMLPLLVPAIVLSLSLLVASVITGVTDAPLRLWAAHSVVVLPYVVRTCLASLGSMPRQVEEAARTLGASRWRVFRHVTLPLIRPGLFAGCAFAFILSFDNVSVSLFLINQKTPTLPLAIMNYVEYNFDPGVAAVSATMVALSLAIAWLVERMVGLRKVLG